MVDNCIAFHIAYVGSILLATIVHVPLVLNNVLYVPNITKNVNFLTQKLLIICIFGIWNSFSESNKEFCKPSSFFVTIRSINGNLLDKMLGHPKIHTPINVLKDCNGFNYLHKTQNLVFC